TEKFSPDLAARRRLRAAWGIQEEEILIGHVGRLDPMKDHPTFLRAAAALARERERLRFVCIGDGSAPYREELHALGRQLGLEHCLIWAGPRSDMPAVQNALDIAVSSSIGEGFPNVIGEAMACGVPCVVTDVGDSAWIVGETGIVVPSSNPDALANGLRKLLDADRSTHAQQVRGRIVENFGIRRLSQSTEQLLDALCRLGKT
ncbi:MAG: glycosyltransferase, partial [Armatimonadota bacterium]|nr:glycosyltransferase [Armatimonadota bacterium]